MATYPPLHAQIKAGAESGDRPTLWPAGTCKRLILFLALVKRCPNDVPAGVDCIPKRVRHCRDTLGH